MIRQVPNFDALRANALALKSFPQRWDATEDDEERQALVDKIVKAVVMKDEDVLAVVLQGDTALLLGERGKLLDLRGGVPKTRQFYEFPIPGFPLNKHMDREALKQMITDLRAEGWSLRQIGEEVGLHFTRVRQLLT